MSNQSQTCEACGARLPANPPGGPCPARLVRSAIGQPAEVESKVELGRDAFHRVPISGAVGGAVE
jgi:hypothetical protein